MNSHGARPVHLIITMIEWIRTSRLSIKNSLFQAVRPEPKTKKGLNDGPKTPEAIKPEGDVAQDRMTVHTNKGLSISLSLTHTQTHTHTLSLSLSHTQTHARSLSRR